MNVTAAYHGQTAVAAISQTNVLVGGPMVLGGAVVTAKAILIAVAVGSAVAAGGSVVATRRGGSTTTSATAGNKYFTGGRCTWPSPLRLEV